MDLPEARIALTVGARGCEYLTQEVTLDRDDLVLRLVGAPEPVPPPPAPVPVPVVPVTAASGGASLGGQLLDLAGNPRANEQIELAAVNATVPAGPWHATTDALGEFAFAGLPAGSFDARWVRREGALTTLDLETRLMLADDESGRLGLQPRGRTTLQGRIEFMTELPQGSVSAGYGTPPTIGAPPDGMPALAVVRLERMVEGVVVPASRRGAFAHAGQFELEGLEPGQWNVEAELVFGANDHSLNSMEVTLPAQGTAEAVLQVLYMR